MQVAAPVTAAEQPAEQRLSRMAHDPDAYYAEARAAALSAAHRRVKRQLQRAASRQT